MSRLSSPGRMGLQGLLHFCLALTVTALLANASGIREWAERLEIGNAYVPRQALVELTGTWEKAVEYTGLNGLRRTALAFRNSQAEPQKIDSPIHYRQPGDVTDLKANKPLHGKAMTGDKVTPLKPDPKLPFSLPGLTPDSNIVLVGDSMMAVGLAPNLSRMIERNSLGKVVRAYKSGTGLARPDVFNWMTEYPKMLGGKNPALVICAIGANDGQGIQVDKKPLRFGTLAWEEEYAKRVGDFLALLLREHAKVYWILLPRMRNPVYDKSAQNLNTFIQIQFKQVPNLVFISPDALITGNPTGGYVEYALTDGKQSDRLRAEDGIHLTDSGARNLASGLLNAMD